MSETNQEPCESYMHRMHHGQMNNAERYAFTLGQREGHDAARELLTTASDRRWAVEQAMRLNTTDADTVAEQASRLLDYVIGDRR